MSGKRRFGVSIPEDVAKDLDILAEKLGTDRSSIVADAIKTYIHDHLHYLYPHECRGIMVVLPGEGGGENKVYTLLEEYRDIIVSYSHVHVTDKCIEFLIVSGSSKRIQQLHKDILCTGCRARYLPLKNI